MYLLKPMILGQTAELLFEVPCGHCFLKSEKQICLTIIVEIITPNQGIIVYHSMQGSSMDRHHM